MNSRFSCCSFFTRGHFHSTSVPLLLITNLGTGTISPHRIDTETAAATEVDFAAAQKTGNSPVATGTSATLKSDSSDSTRSLPDRLTTATHYFSRNSVRGQALLVRLGLLLLLDLKEVPAMATHYPP